MNKQIFGCLVIVSSLLPFAGKALAECLVASETTYTEASLPNQLNKNYNKKGIEATCSTSGLDKQSGFDQAILFTTTDWDVGYAKTHVDEIILKDPLEFNNSKKNLVIGNWPLVKPPVDDPATSEDEAKFSYKGYKSFYDPKTAHLDKNGKPLYDNDDGSADDGYGLVTLDAAVNFVDNESPFTCSGSTLVVLRGLIIRTKGISRNELFTQNSCLKDGGWVFVCPGDLVANKDPRVDTGWCDQEDADGDGFSVDEGDCDDNDVTVFPMDVIDDPNTPADENCDGLNGGYKLVVNPVQTSIAQGQTKAFTLTLTYEGGYKIPATVEVQGQGINAADGQVSASTLNLTPAANAGSINITTVLTTPAKTYPLSFVAKSEYTVNGVTKTYEVSTPGSLKVEVTGSEGDYCAEQIASGKSVVDVCKDPLCAAFCDGDGDLHCENSAKCIDGTTPGDCDDADITKFPGNPEICDGKDNNCDGQIDEGVLKTYYPDVDGDNFGDKKASKQACKAPADHTTNNKDCNDDEVTINPDAKENCSDGVDNDCDGDTDMDDNECQDGDGSCPDGTHPQVYFEDQDGDAFGSVYVQEMACAVPAGFVKKGGDCLDTNSAVNPLAKEICDGLDNNCDAVIDHMDNDKDGYVSVCPNDCDDDDAKTNPGMAEICGDGFDQDCDGTDMVCKECTDGDAKTWFIDHDKDGDGNPAVSTKDCEQPDGYVGNDNDCNDNDPTVNSFATEAGGGCEDGVDNDCDGAKDLDEAICQLEPPPPPPGEFDPDFLGGGFSDGCSLNRAASNGSPVTTLILFGLLAVPVIFRFRKMAANESRNIF